MSDSTVATEPLTAFVLARIDEDERWAGSLPPAWRIRVERICGSRRGILREHVPTSDPEWRRCSTCAHEVGWSDDGDGGEFYDNSGWFEDWPCRTVRLLAHAYKDHADYRDEWVL